MAYSAHRHTGELLEQIGIGADDDYLHAAPAADSARNSVDDLCALQGSRRHAQSVAQVYRKFFAGSPMVRIYENALPQIQYSVRTNYADIGFQLSRGWTARGDRELPRQSVEGRISDRRCRI